MKLFFMFFSLIFVNQAFANSAVDQAFKDFFNSPKLVFNRCGNNIHFFLQYLDDEGITYDKGTVVAVYEPTYYLHHFDARWGAREKYTNGKEFYRANWAFHVFVVIDGKVYDFSQRGQKTQTLKEYLRLAFLPAHTTVKAPFKKTTDINIELSKHVKLKMEFIKAEDYKIKVSNLRHYQGRFIDLFRYAFDSEYKQREVGENELKEVNPRKRGRSYPHSLMHTAFSYESKNQQDEKTEYYGIKATNNLGDFPIQGGDAAMACLALGHKGSLLAENILSASTGEKYIEIRSSAVQYKEGHLQYSDRIRLFVENKLQDTFAPHVKSPFMQYLRKLVCTNSLKTFL